MLQNKSSALIAFLILVIIFTNAGFATCNQGKTYRLQASPSTTWTGYFDNSRPPVLTIQSGDIVDMSTYMLFNDKLKPGLTLGDLAQLDAEFMSGGYSPHTLTGPIYISGAAPGDVLEIKIIKLTPRPNGVNFNEPGVVGVGALAEDFPDGQIKDFQFDLKKMTTQFAPGIEIPLHPFFGTLGVAPAQPGKIPTFAPGDFGGNMDCKELIAGTTLYLPVFVPGALVAGGDCHAAQGDGEANVTAIETAFDHAVLQFFVHKDMNLTKPFAETPTHYIAFGFDPDLDVAAKMALREMIKFLTTKKEMTPLDAYSLCSVAVDLRVTQLVDGNKGIHAMLPKSIFGKKSSGRDKN